MFIFVLLNCALAGTKPGSPLSPPVSLFLNASLILSVCNLLGVPGMKSFPWPPPASPATSSVDSPRALAVPGTPNSSRVILVTTCLCAKLIGVCVSVTGSCSLDAGAPRPESLHSLVLAAQWAFTTIGFYPGIQGSSRLMGYSGNTGWISNVER